MDELTLGLIGAGAVVVGRGRVQRVAECKGAPQDAAAHARGRRGEFAREDHQEQSPFIEPARPTTRREPVVGAESSADTASARVEPTFGVPVGAAPLDTPADIQAETTTPNGYLSDGDDAEVEGGTKGGAGAGADKDAAAAAGQQPASTTSRETDEQIEPILPAATTISSAPPAIVDRRIDCIVPIRLNGPVAGDKVIPLAQRLRRAGSKPVHIEGKLEGGAWELLQNGARYEELRAAAQLANRSGALNELEFSEFVTGVQQFADAIDASPEFPDMLETVAMARELDGFAAQCDAQLSINVLSDGAPWSANYVQAVASQDGLLLSRDGTRFVKLDARQSPVFMLQFGDTNFLRDDLTYKGGQMITLVLDVPVADEDILPFRLMCDYAKSLAERIGGRVVDDGRRPLPETALLAIEKQLMTLYAKLEQAGIPAGSPATRRLFSQ